MVKLIIDTDLGGDSDDVGALSLAHNMMNLGYADLLAVTTCSSACYSAVTVKWINEIYGHGDIPVGVNRQRAWMEDIKVNAYSYPLSQEYLSSHPEPEFDSSLDLLRRTLAGNTDVKIVTIGTLNNIADLLRSGPDGISPLSGKELVSHSVSSFYIMGGEFTDPSFAEYNIQCDIESSRYVSENCPVPIVYSGFEFGQNVYTGINLGKDDKTNPLYRAYRIVSDNIKWELPVRDSWDPITVYAAVMDGIDRENFEKVSNLKISFSEEGCACVAQGGSDSYLKLLCSNEKMRDILDGYIHI